MIEKRVRLLGAACVAALSVASSVTAGPIGSEPRALQPTSRTADAITGPIILSADRIIFASGAVVELTQVNDAVLGSWNPNEEVEGPAQVFRLTSDPGELLNGNSLCGEPATFLAISQSRFFNTWSLDVSAFSGAAEPTGLDSPGLCATFSYALDAQLPEASHDTPEATVRPPTEEASTPTAAVIWLQPSQSQNGPATSPVQFTPDALTFDDGRTVSLQLIQAIPAYAGGAISSTDEGYLFSVSGAEVAPLDAGEFCEAGSSNFMFATVRRPDGGDWLSLDFFQNDPRGKHFPEAGFCVGLGFEVPTDLDLFTGMPEPTVLASELQPPDPGLWRTSRTTNPVDDTPTITVALTARTGQSRYGNAVEFIARCQSNRTEAFIIWHDYLGDDSSRGYDYKYVTVRVGSEPATTEEWGLSTSGDATFAPDWAGDLLKRMLTADQLVVQTTPYGESPVTAIFDTQGLDVALRDLSDTCNWTY